MLKGLTRCFRYTILSKNFSMSEREQKIKEAIKRIRSLSNPKETERSWEKRYGHGMSTCKYFKGGLEVAKVYRTDNEIVFIEIEEEIITF